MKSVTDHYRDAGVDVNAGYRAVELMKSHVQRTMLPGAISEVGGFGGMWELDLEGIKRPVLVSGTDGVGTKLKIAFLADRHDTIGIDCVAMCVNDIVCCGAKPLFFLDYLACGKNVPERIAEIVAGVAEGCVQAGCTLIGGETAEMPGFYAEDEYDLAGFAVGVVDKDRIIKNDAKPGDVLLGIRSSGLHSNGFSLVRKALDVDNADLGALVPELGCTLGEELLRPTRIVVKALLGLQEAVRVKGIANITGGGFFENIPRMLPKDVHAVIRREAVPVLPIFELIQQRGNIPEREMFGTFNMGIFICLAVSPEDAELALRTLEDFGEDAVMLGEVADGGGEVRFI